MPWAVAVATGLMLVLSFPPFALPLVAWFALLPLLFAIRDAGAARRATLGALVGLVWASGTVAPWLYPAARAHLDLGPLGAIGLVVGAGALYGALYVGAFAAVYPSLPAPRWISAPAAWVLLEAVRTRALGGMPWVLLGHSQSAVLPVAQLAELGGVAAISWLVAMPAVALAERGRARRRGLLASTVAVGGALAFGALRLGAPPASDAAGWRIHAVSGWNLAADPVADYAAATLAAPPAALTIWPEGATPGYLQEDHAAEAVVADVGRRAGWLLVGARRYETRDGVRRYFTGAVLVDPDGHRQATYDKAFLVPLAEGPPPLALLPSVPRPFTPGEHRGAPLVAGDLRIGALVCWEAVLPEPARRTTLAGADVLVNLTSDRDLGTGAAQQVAFTRFRAIETRRWVVRASGTGTTLLIDPQGRVTARDAFVLPRPDVRSETLYVRYGDVVPWLAGLALAALAVRRRYERRDALDRERMDVVAAP